MIISFKKIIALHLLLTLLSSISLAQLKVVKVFYDEEEKQLKEAYEMDLGDNGWEKTGYYKSYFKSGRLALEGNFKQNKPNGWFKEYYDTTFSKKTPLKSQVFYENGLKNGKMWALNMQGDTIQKANFKDNQLEGDFLSYYPNGKIFRKSFFKDTNVEGLVEEFYESGKIAKKMYFKNGQIDSICAYYYESGNIKAKEFYKNGLLNGLQSTYYDANSSPIQSNYFMRNNVKIGKEEIFAENGNLVQVAFYENGLLEGDYKQWYADTKRPKYEANYQKGYKNGKEILYFNTEKPIIKQLSEYSDREKYKTSRFYNEDGDIVFEAQYIDNQLNGEVNLYNIEQHLWERKYYEKGRKNGKSFSYYDKKREKICVEAHYQQDVLEGSYQEFDKTGKLRLKGQYQKGKKVGKWYFYDEKNKETIKVF